ncbi:MAG: SDR family NAD(P)-dependent oxidoreductase [Alphaproteobacteria bacterium]|nr:MAG: SDR family NAD(P)-dependent oxidoreductase [Alphaproteobacteria bacterium]
MSEAADAERPLALITGASGGIGAAFAELLAEEGYDLFLVARGRPGLEAVADRCRAEGAQVHLAAVDLTGRDSGAQVESSVCALQRRVSLLVNNAGYGLMAPVGQRPLDDELGIVDLNVRVLAELSHRFLADLKTSGGGIINVSSLIAYQPMPYFTLYSASKAFVQTYSRMLRRELAREGVRVMALCPGYTQTGFQKRAGAEVGAAERFMPKHAPRRVARDGWRAFQRGRAVKIVGWGNWLVARLGVLTTPFVGLVAHKAYALATKHQGEGEADEP